MPLAQKFLRQAAQFAARIVQQFTGVRLVSRQDDPIPLDGKYQGRLRREHDAKLLFGGGQNLHQPRDDFAGRGAPRPVERGIAAGN